MSFKSTQLATKQSADNTALIAALIAAQPAAEYATVGSSIEAAQR